ncbi:MAG: hypothetical protein SAJ12_10410 [Jaaginema sp. PMC 1079.18]|nr:hypothetical protein [Jaaginema sp. PMC 1080.18]MEC4851413.1 hypothetical protein [Jaaginema sp. PMC 1079.18]MEC4866191.1 hypothetical protein [Jaaginema sp. PMC 1078.18]
MKYSRSRLIFLLVTFVFSLTLILGLKMPSYAILQSCQIKGFRLYGKVQIVDVFPDIKIQAVNSNPDLRVKIVDDNPNECGEWQIVQTFPNYKVKFVEAFPDLKIQFVNNSPGIPRSQ